MKPAVLALLVVLFPVLFQAQSVAQKTPPTKPPAAQQEIETETIGAPPATPPPATAQTATAGYLEPAQVKALLHRIWLAQFRINDLLAQVQPDRWRMSEGARKSFWQTLESLHRALTTEEGWRAQFDTRPDSLYLGFQTYVAMNAVLPRLDGVAHGVTQYVNPSFGAQYSQALNQLYDLQQSLQPHLASLLKNQDGLLFATQTNLASCQNQLGFAMHPREEKAIPMRNIAPVFRGRHTHPAAESRTESKKSKEKNTSPGKPGTNKAAASTIRPTAQGK